MVSAWDTGTLYTVLSRASPKDDASVSSSLRAKDVVVTVIGMAIPSVGKGVAWDGVGTETGGVRDGRPWIVTESRNTTLFPLT